MCCGKIIPPSPFEKGEIGGFILLRKEVLKEEFYEIKYFPKLGHIGIHR
jgi:hypothetical protein